MSLDAPPEIAEPHRHRRGGPPPWLEWATSISALVVSISSIVIALHHGDTMDRLVKANSYPYLFGGFSDATPEGVERISIDFINNGVGPADERSLKIRFGDHYARSVGDLVRTVIGPAEGDAAVTALHSYKNGAHTRFIPAHDKQFVFWINKTPQNASYWDRLDQGLSDKRQLLHIEFCYCSVFGECWSVRDEDRAPVKQCARDEPHEFMP
jgi:hypothetical protein